MVCGRARVRVAGLDARRAYFRNQGRAGDQRFTLDSRLARLLRSGIFCRGARCLSALPTLPPGIRRHHSISPVIHHKLPTVQMYEWRTILFPHSYFVVASSPASPCC